MEKRPTIKVLIANAQNGDQDAVVQLVRRFIPLVKKYSRRVGYEEAYTDLIAWFVSAVHKYKTDGMESEMLKRHLFTDKEYQ